MERGIFYMEFNDLVINRRSANNFDENVAITEADLKPIFEQVKLAPSAFNLQHTEYTVVMDKPLKEKVRQATGGQYKVHTASAVIIVTADRYAYEQTGHINEGMKNLGMITEKELEDMIESTTAFYDVRGEGFKKDEAIRNGALSAMLFMLAAKNAGWDTCPMIGFDEEKLREVVDVPETHEIALMITIGKEAGTTRMRGYRKPVNEFVKFI